MNLNNNSNNPLINKIKPNYLNLSNILISLKKINSKLNNII